VRLALFSAYSLSASSPLFSNINLCHDLNHI
jgi:hypothetical protein